MVQQISFMLRDIRTGQQYPISPRGLRIGRTPHNDVVLRDAKVSRHHTTLWMQAGQLYIRDENSTNGTWVNDERITSPMALQVGDQVRIGDAAFEVARGAAPPFAAQTPAPARAGLPVVPIAIAGGVVLLVFIALMLRAGRGVIALPTATPALTSQPTSTPIAPSTATATATSPPMPTHTPIAPPPEPATPSPRPTATATPTPTHTPTPAPTNTSTATATHTPTNTPMPTSTSTPTDTPVPPTATSTPTPTPVDWATADWAVMARVLLDSAKTCLPQMQEVQAMLAEDQVNCPRLVQLLDNLANALQYEEMIQPLWDRRGQPGLEGRLWNIRDAYADGVNQFRLDTFRSVRDTCAAGTQPTTEQQESALHWMEFTGPVGKMEYVIHEVEPVIGP